MRTGQAHRTLLGHTAPLTAVQFDEIHVVSSARDGTVRIWDLRSGGRTAELLRFGAARQSAATEFGLSSGVSEYSGVGPSVHNPNVGPLGGHGVGDVQFDTRKIVAAGDTGVEVRPGYFSFVVCNSPRLHCTFHVDRFTTAHHSNSPR